MLVIDQFTFEILWHLGKNYDNKFVLSKAIEASDHSLRMDKHSRTIYKFPVRRVYSSR